MEKNETHPNCNSVEVIDVAGRTSSCLSLSNGSCDSLEVSDRFGLWHFGAGRLSVLVVGLLTLIVVPLNSLLAQNYGYTTSAGLITITSYTGTGGVVTIPGTINGMPVVGIGPFAFIGKSSLTSVTIPASVTSIGDSAFAFDTSLTNIAIGDAVTNIGNNSFAGCSGLINMGIPDSVTSIGNGAYSGCYGLTNVTIGSGVTNIGFVAFLRCTSLRAIEINAANQKYSSVDGVVLDKAQTTVILCPEGKSGAFSIPDSAATIGNSAFSGCTILGSVAIGKGVSGIGSYAFYNCTSLTNIAADAANPVFSSVDGVLFDKSQTSLIQCPGGRTGSYSIPNNVTNLGISAFQYCNSLTNVAIPGSVNAIGSFAFDSCTSLTNIAVDATNPNYSSADGVVLDKTQTTLIIYPGGKKGGYSIPTSVTSIGDKAFQDCYNLASVIISVNVTTIGSDAFLHCTGLTNMVIPSNVTRIGTGAFSGCGGLTNMTIGTGVTSIGDSALSDCTSLSTITIPASVTSLGSEVFYGCSSLASVYFMGNAPLAGNFDFFLTDSATVYYLPGTSGWQSTFSDQPAVLWNPTPQISGLANPFAFTITGSSNVVVVVEAATSLASPDWTPVSTNTLTDGSSSFSDPGSANYPARFYRLRSP